MDRKRTNTPSELKWTDRRTGSSFKQSYNVNAKITESSFPLVHILVHFKRTEFGSFKKDYVKKKNTHTET